MNTLLKILLPAFLLIYAVESHAQQIAHTRDGSAVILYDDGTWEYADWDEHRSDIEIDESGSGTSADIVIKNNLRFRIRNGMLDGFEVLRGNGIRLYDNMSGKLRKIGPYELEYEFSTERLKKVGAYKIEYDFSSGKITRIGSYPIEYDFHTGKISRIGNTYFKYSFFNGKLTEVKGDTSGIKITVF